MEPIRDEVLVDASADAVWRAWTHSNQVSAWFSPKANIEPRQGGAYELFFDPTDPDHMSTKGCVVEAIVRPSHLRFTWKGPDPLADVMNRPGRLTVVDVTLEASDAGTRVILEHGGWGDGPTWEKAREWHVSAWRDVLNSLKAHLERGSAEPCCE